MMPSLILMFSLGALAQFAFSYCRTLLFASGEASLSDRVQEIAGISANNVPAADFDRLLQLVCFAPRFEGDAAQMRTIKIYYRVASCASKIAAPISVEISQWLSAELSRCAYFAAVALDRRLAMTPTK
ncbi:MAG TPA: hypothetical protein VKS44_12490 [Candidatus Acidoferrales bacterium]|nr:hypothetical protein [Candidatus Acidoferrales bacterium]